MRTSWWIVGSLCTWALLACTPSEQRGSSSQEGRGGEGGELSAAEWAAYAANQNYLHSFVKPGVRIRLNLADPRQWELTMARLKMSGKTPENSPYLFELLEGKRSEQLARGIAAGTVAETVEDLPTASRSEQHLVSEARFESSDSSTVLGRAESSFPGGTFYTYVSVDITSSSGLPVGRLEYREEYAGDEGEELAGAFVPINTSGDGSRARIRRFFVSTQKFEESETGGFADSYKYEVFGNAETVGTNEVPLLSYPGIDAPVDTKGPQGGPPDDVVSVCIHRGWTEDCDYSLRMDTPISCWLEMPFKGETRILTNHKFDWEKIERLKTVPGGSLNLLLTTVGGGCQVTAQNESVADMSTFWKQVKLWDEMGNRVVDGTGEATRLTWDMTGENVAFFDESCCQSHYAANLTLTAYMPMRTRITNGETGTLFTVTSDQTTTRPPIKQILLTNSCLAEGTLIELGDGASAPIESLQIGQAVFNPYTPEQRSLTITDTARGVEPTPMVRIRDEAGRTLLLTEMHPVATPDRGMLQARALLAGDRVLTKEGPSRLVEVGREPYDGKVYNLKVGSQSEMTALGPDQTVLYANGFVVGDGQIQSKYESLVKKQENRAQKRPERWDRDLLGSRLRK